jgi:hypothetical protein
MDKTYSIKDVSEHYHKKPETIRKWCRNGILKAKNDPCGGWIILSLDKANMVVNDGDKDTPEIKKVRDDITLLTCQAEKIELQQRIKNAEAGIKDVTDLIEERKKCNDILNTLRIDTANLEQQKSELETSKTQLADSTSKAIEVINREKQITKRENEVNNHDKEIIEHDNALNQRELVVKELETKSIETVNKVHNILHNIKIDALRYGCNKCKMVKKYPNSDLSQLIMTESDGI